MKPWFSYKNRRRSSYASRILISKTGMASWDNSGQNEAQIFEIRQKLSEREQKKALSLYFRADINNSPTILTRIVSQFRIFRTPISALRLALFSKYVTKN
jgi:DNA-directed RNA polymerase specialized sigma subunit